MKKLSRITLTAVIVLLVATLMSLVVFAADTPAVSSSVFYTHQGETFTTTIYIPDGANIVDFDLTLKYDTELLTLKTIEENEDVKGTVIFNANDPGVLSINYTRTSGNVTKYMPLLDVTFAVNDNIGIGSYDCFSVDDTQAYIAHRLDDSGNPVEVNFGCDFAPLVIYEMGDVDLSGSVDIGDATRIRRHLARFEGSILSDFKLTLADTYYDGTIDVGEAVALQRHLARLEGTFGNRVNVTFYDKEGNKYAKKSVVFGGTLYSVPGIPTLTGFSGGMWSQSPDKYVAPVYSDMEKDISLYAYYSDKANPAMDYYKKQLATQLYSGDMPTNLSSDLNLLSSMNYQNGWHATFLYSSDSNYVVNSTTGAFTKPTYPQKLDLTVSITSYDNNDVIDSEDRITFSYDIPGIYPVPEKSEIRAFLEYYFTDNSDGRYRINYDVKLLSKVDNAILDVDGTLYDNFEVRLSWFQNVDGALVPVSQIKRTTESQINDYVAVATFNGKPLEDDGKIYIDDVEVTAIDQLEIKNYIINQIAANMGTLATEGTELWDNDTVYGTHVTWETGAPDIGYVSNNVVELENDAVSGSTLPLNARVSYAVDGGTEEFVLSYNLTVSCNNTIIKAPENMDSELYRAIKSELEDTMGYRGDLTAAALADVRFVNLDLSDYPDITSLRGLSYCKNLRTLNISGLHITDGTMNQIATLSYLEAFIARGCGLDNLSDGGTPTLRNAVNLKMIDLTDNNFTSLDSVFAEGIQYGSLREVYLSKNQLTDINALSRAPMMTYLSLSDNGLTTEGTACIEDYPYLQYLSLANNQIDSVEHLTGLKYLVELRLQNNQLTDVNALRRLVNLEILYLGHNNILDIGNLNTLTNLQVLYVNDNRISDISTLRSLTKLESINVCNNRLTSLAVLNNYKTTIAEIYAENNSLTDFSFINGATNLHILMLAGNETAMAQDNMVSWLSELPEMETLTLSDIQLTDLSFLSGMGKLVRLDVANCGLNTFSGETSNIQMIADRYSTLKVLDISDNDFSDGGSELMRLRNITLLTVLYADNICSDLDAFTLTYSMTELKYISLENCGVATSDWLSKFGGLEYVDLAGNKLTEVDLEQCISNASRKTLKELYLDTTVPCTFVNAYRVMDFALERLSLGGITIGSMENMPNLDQIQYLNLDGTGLTDLTGEDPEMYNLYSIERYSTLRTVDVSHLDADISPVEELPTIQTVYAVGAIDRRSFYEDNLHSLQRLYNNGVTCYLYDKENAYEPVAQEEGVKILSLLPDISCDITVAADGIISDNNPTLIGEINDFEITWTVNNSTNYEIADSVLKVKDYTSIDDETLTVTATITVYPDQEVVSRDFEIDTHILRVSDFASVISETPLSLAGFLPVAEDDFATESDLENEAVTENVTEDAEAPAESKQLVEETDSQLSGDEEQSDAVLAVSEGNTESIAEEAEVSGLSLDEAVETELDGEAQSETATPEESHSSETEGSSTEETYSSETNESPVEEADEDGSQSDDIIEGDSYSEETAVSPDKAANNDEPQVENVAEEDAYLDEDSELLAAETTDEAVPLWLDEASVTQYSETIPCLVYNISGLDENMMREDTFTYAIEIQATDYPGFSTPVKPVVDEIRYAYSTILDSGVVTPYGTVLDVDSDGAYNILDTAPLNSVTTITTSIGHFIDTEFVEDQTMQRSFKITSRSNTVTYVVNGGRVTLKEDGSEVSSQRLAEDTVMFRSVNVARTGYIFGGWYLDEKLENLFYDGTAEVTMPAHDLILFAKWTAHSYNISFDATEGTLDADPILALCDQPIGALPVPARPLYTFDGWYTEKDGGELVTQATIRTTADDIILYAHWTANTHKITFDANGTTNFPAAVDPAAKNVTCDNAVGTLPVPTRTGFTFNGWYTAASGGSLITEETIYEDDNDITAYAQWSVRNYVVSWSTGTGYSISVKRTSSPNGNGSIGALSSGEKVYYGDELSITYAASTGYSIATKGATAVTVSGNVTSSTIYATATANNYTYTVNYVSANGTNLGSSSATYAYGTTHTIAPPAISGYSTPASQTVTWDSTSKTIRFVYPVASVGYTTKTGTAGTDPKTTYSATIQYQNRTKDSVQIRVSWTSTIVAGGYNIYGQQLRVTAGGTSKYTTVAAFRAWQYAASYARSSTGTTDWITVPLSTTNQTSVSVAIYYYQTNTNGTDMCANYGMGGVSTTWTASIPAY